MKTITFLLLLTMFSNAAAQDSSWIAVDGFSTVDGYSGRKIAATAIVGGLLVGSIVDSYYSWWKGAEKPFSFYTESWFSEPHLGIDKLGHFYTSYFYFHTFRNVLLWGGHDASTALWWAAGTSALFAVSVEIGDGFSPYGFDVEDMVFNLGGLGYGMLQTQYAVLKNFNFKFSYVPSDGYRFPPRFTQYYDAHTYWLTVNVHGLLPSRLQDYWPEFIQLAVGYGVDDKGSKREGVIGLDFNLDVFKTTNEDLLLARKTLNSFHFPAPAVKFTQTKKPRYYLFQTD